MSPVIRRTNAAGSELREWQLAHVPHAQITSSGAPSGRNLETDAQKRTRMGLVQGCLTIKDGGT